MQPLVSLWVGMLVVIAAWLLLFKACAGAGWIIFHRQKSALTDYRDLWLYFWAGWGLMLLFLQVWHLFAPVTALAGAIWVLFGGSCLFFGLKKQQRIRKVSDSSRNKPENNAGNRKTRVFFALLVVLTCIWVANRAMVPLENGDSGLYHLGSVRWNASYPIVPGLANLHARFGYNSTFFLYAAVFEPPEWLSFGDFSAIPYTGFAYHFANGLLLVIFTIGLLAALYRMATGDKRNWRSDLFQSVFILFLPYLFFEHAADLSNDLAVFCLGSVVGAVLCRLIFDEQDAEELDWLTAVVLICAAAGISLKLSFAALGGSASAAALYLHIRRHKAAQRPVFGKRKSLWLLALITVLVWIGRGYILSGYPFFPATFGALPLRWQVPAEIAENESRWIASWGRKPYAQPEEVLGSWEWLLPKLKKSFSRIPEFILPLGIFLTGAMVFMLRWRRGSVSPVWREASLLTLPPVLALAFWFLSSPNIRFAGASFWWLAGAGAVLCVADQEWVFRCRLRTAYVIAAFALGLFAFLALKDGFWITPGSGGAFNPARQANVTDFSTESYLVLHVPVEDDRCWDAPLPCTPYPDASLELLEPENLGGGFCR